MGGAVIDYAIKAKKTKSVRFDGLCASACTLYLSVPDKCATPRARFAFHRVYGSTPSGDEIATQYLWRNYPEWVRRWLIMHGGLTSTLKIMPNSYIRKYIKVCRG